jgi:hypothetical protein
MLRLPPAARGADARSRLRSNFIREALTNPETESVKFQALGEKMSKMIINFDAAPPAAVADLSKIG